MHWQVVIHVAFLFSAIAIALIDRLMTGREPLKRSRHTASQHG
jgi:hypothetical protein